MKSECFALDISFKLQAGIDSAALRRTQPIHGENEKQITFGACFCFTVQHLSSKLELLPWKTKRPSCEGLAFHLSVIPLGLEPRTHTLKVYCSTN